ARPSRQGLSERAASRPDRATSALLAGTSQLRRATIRPPAGGTMIPLSFDYTAPSRVTSDRDRTRLGLSADARRPVRFTARVVRHVLSLRLALQTLVPVLWSGAIWFPPPRAPTPLPALL